MPGTREEEVEGLRTQVIAFKRTLHAIRTSSDLHRSVAPAGVPLLGVLHRHGPQRVTNLAGEVGLDTSTVSRQIDALLRSGHVEKVRDPADGRAWLVQLTATGRDALRDHLASIGEALHDLLDAWSTDDLHTLSTLLGRLNDDVRARFTAPSSPIPAAAPAEMPAASSILEEPR